MSDIFREVDDALRRQRFIQMWRRYTMFIIFLVIGLVLLVGGFGYWQAQAIQRQIEASLKLDEALEESPQGAKLNALERLSGEGGIYAIFADFHRASTLTEMQEWEEASGIYQDLAETARTPQPLRDLARVRGGLAMTGRANFDDIKTMLEPAAASSGYFRSTAREALALAALQAGEVETARENLQKIVDDATAPPSIARRAQLVLEHNLQRPLVSEEETTEEVPEVELAPPSPTP